MKIFGREPAAWLALVAVAVQFAAGWGVDLSESQQAMINAAATAVMGLAIAVMVARDRIIPAAAGALVAVLQLMVAFGAHMNQEQITLAGAALTTALAWYLREKVVAPVSPEMENVPKV